MPLLNTWKTIKLTLNTHRNMTMTMTQPSLQVRRLIKTTRARAFEAWTKPELLKQWFGGGVCQLTSSKMDVRVGGAYALDVANPEKGNHQIQGVYREVTPPARLVFTWDCGCRGDAHKADTLVTVDFTEKDGGTEVCITHERFPDAETCDGHKEGWTRLLERLAELLG